MPITKQYGKGSPVVRHNNSLDLSTKDNTAAGDTLGATPALDNGWSYPPAGPGDWASGGRFRAFFPTPELPNFRDCVTDIKRPTDDFSEKMSFNIIYPWVSSSSGARSGRCETYTNHASQKEQFTCVRMSVYRPVGQAVDPRLGHIFYQVHNGSGSPSMSLIEHSGGHIEFRIYGGPASAGASGSQVTTGIMIGTLTRGVWHEFTIFTRWIFGTNSSAQGYHLLFYGNKIARSFLRVGSAPSVTITPGQTPRQTGSTSQSQYSLNTEFLGNMPLQVTELGIVRDLVFYKGRTMADPDYNTLYPKWGIYKSNWGSSSSQHYNDDATINALLDGGSSWTNAVLSNPNNLPTAQTTYAPPELRTGIIHTSCALGNVGPGETHEFMFEQLNDGLKIDLGDRNLIASEPELSWFTLNAQAETYTLNIISSPGGNVTGLSGSYNEGTEVTVTATPNSGYSFSRWRNAVTNETVSFLANFNFIIPNSDITIQAMFTQIITPEPGGRLRGKLRKKNI